MIHSIIGLIVGFSLGLTGAGGSLVALPLFINLAHHSVREATVLSLIIVSLGAFLNLLFLKDSPRYKLSLLLLFFGTLSNYASSILKGSTPESIIVLLLICVGSYGLWGIWKKQPAVIGLSTERPLYFTAGIGAILGVLTTLTGLGGGVLLVPILMKAYGFTYTRAMPTSLMTISLMSLSSLLLQIPELTRLIDLHAFILLSVGAATATITLKFVLPRFDKEKVELTR
jgi:uncharacterized membrane protein YfcA